MGTKERLKLEFDFIKVLVVVFLTALFSTTAYAFVHRHALTTIDFIFIGCGLVFLLSVLVVLLKKGAKVLNQLERLE
ncbi:hypothetical protein HHE014_14970 [Helicobacter heilmannii]|nr:hypothetical protein HHE014_14970 [Helicobacter heilmannii]